MRLAQKLLRRPRTSLLWKLNFQIHLWIGILITLYLIVIGVTGSILVFRVELARLSADEAQPAWTGKAGVDVEQVLSNIQAEHPTGRVLSVITPTPDEPLFNTRIQDRGRRISVRSDPQTGKTLRLLERTHTWLDFIADLHITLLTGIEGRKANGAGGALLLIVNLTGLVIWWPGIKLWKRGLIVDVRRSWRRVNFDVHRAVGFWAISILSFWAISGIYFGWPSQVFAVVNRLSPIVSAQPPAVVSKPVLQLAPPSLSTMIASAQSLDPGTTLAGINFPYSRRAPFEVLMLRPGGRGREYTDTIYFNPWDGKHLATWRYGVNESLGDWIIWSQVPLHFGTFWGLGVKILWAALGLTIPILSVTGALLYWNRVLRHVKIGVVSRP